MTTVYLAPGPFGAGGQFFGLGGLPLNLGTITTYAAGSTTPLATYTTSAGSVQNANPIVLGTDGRPPNEIWITGDSYRLDLKDALGNLIRTYDNLGGYVDTVNLAASASATLGAGMVGFSHANTYGQHTVGLALNAFINVKNAPYNAVGDGVTDDTAAMRAAAAAVNAAGGGIFYVPRGKYLMTDASGTELLLFTMPIILQGEGLMSKIVVGASTGATTDIIRVAPAAGGGDFSAGQGSFVTLRDFGIFANSGTPGRHAVNIDLSTAGATIYARRWAIERVWLGPLGGRGIVLNNGTFASPTHGDGFFTSCIRQSQIYNGIQLIAGGDSINIMECTLAGSNCGVEASLISGAAKLVVAFCNITNTGGAVWIKAGFGVSIIYNQLDQRLAVSGGSGNAALIDLDGSDENLTQPIVEGNVITASLTNAVTDLVRVNSCTGAIVRHNTYRPPSGQKAIRITASASGTLVGRGEYNLTSGGGIAADLGTNTTWNYERGLIVSAFAASFTANASNSEVIRIAALTGNITINAPTNIINGNHITYLLLQDGVGGWNVTWNPAFVQAWSDTGNTAGKRASITFVFDGSNLHQVGAQRAWS